MGFDRLKKQVLDLETLVKSKINNLNKKKRTNQRDNQNLIL